MVTLDASVTDKCSSALQQGQLVEAAPQGVDLVLHLGDLGGVFLVQRRVVLEPVAVVCMVEFAPSWSTHPTPWPSLVVSSVPAGVSLPSWVTWGTFFSIFRLLSFVSLV